jgi:hypothetical protein
MSPKRIVTIYASGPITAEKIEEQLDEDHVLEIEN